MVALVVDEGAHAAPVDPPATMIWPGVSVPFCTSTVATEPRPRSSWASMTSAFRRAVRIGLEIEDFGLQQDRLEQLVERWPVLGGNLDDRALRRPCDSTNDLVLQQLGATPVCGLASGLSILLIATMIGTPAALAWLIDFDGLRHHAVVGRHHEDGDVGRLRAAGTHGREGRVAGGVDEGDLAGRSVSHLVGADVLRDAAGFARNHVGVADGVEQRGLAVVDVAHDGHDRRTR